MTFKLRAQDEHYRLSNSCTVPGVSVSCVNLRVGGGSCPDRRTCGVDDDMFERKAEDIGSSSTW
jgi:hypothetical protein